VGYSRCSDEPRWLNIAKIWRSKHGSMMCWHDHLVGLREEDVLLDDTHVGRLPQFPPAPLSQAHSSEPPTLSAISRPRKTSSTDFTHWKKQDSELARAEKQIWMGHPSLSRAMKTVIGPNWLCGRLSSGLLIVLSEPYRGGL
jgi:hypothetical protein